MKMLKWCLTVIGFAGLLIESARAQEVLKADNGVALNDVASWVGDTVPGNSHTAVWDAPLSGASTVDIGAAMTWAGLRILNPGGPVTINGTQRLTLSESPNPGLDMSGAWHDLTLNTPVTFSGGNFSLAVAAGRTATLANITRFGGIKKFGDGTVVVNNPDGTGSGETAITNGIVRFTGTGTINHRLRWEGGTVIFDGSFNMTHTDTNEGLGIYKGTAILADGSFSVTNTGRSRIFAGRTRTDSDGTIIVSNGTHRIPGGGGGSSTDSNFIGVSHAKRGRLFMESGQLMFNNLRLATNDKGGQVNGEPDLITVNNGLLQVLGTDLPFKMGSGHASDVSGRSGRITVNGGRFEIPNGLMWFSYNHNDSVGDQEIILNDGTFAIKQLSVGSSPQMTRTVIFNGGTFEGTNAANGAELILNPANAAFLVRAGGAVLSAASGSDFRFSAYLAEDATSPGGGLVKTGPGRITLAGVNTYTGPTVVSNGWLGVSGASALPATPLTVGPGAGLSLVDGALATFTPPAGLRIGLGDAPALLEAEVAASGSACDQLVLPAGVWLGRLAVNLVQQGTRNPVTREGDFAVLSYAGTAPLASAFSWGNPSAGLVCTFEVDTAQKLVTARVRIDPNAPVDNTATWTSPTSGMWSDHLKWTTLPINSPDTDVCFSAIPTTPVTVTLNAPATVGTVTFDNANAYTLLGSGAGSLILGGGASAASVTLAQGSHNIEVPLTLDAPVTFDAPASSQTLRLAAPVTGSGALLKTGSGDLDIASSANTYEGGTTLSGGNITIRQPDVNFGSGPIRLNVAMGSDTGRLRNRSGTSLTITNDVLLGVGSASIEANDGPVILEGALDWLASGDFNKAGTHELVLKGKTSETSGRINIRTGSIRAAAGAEVTFTASSRETLYMTESTGTPRSFTVDSGATVRIGGLFTGACVSNTVFINGGSLTFTGTGDEVGLIRQATGTEGTDRIILNDGSLTFAPDRWLSVGVRGGGAEIIVNRGRASFGRLSLGVRADSGFGSTGEATYANVFINGGTSEIVNVLNWMGDVTAGRTNCVYLNGGTLRLPTTFRSISTTNPKSSQFTLNGGVLELAGVNTFNFRGLGNYLDGLTDLFIGQNGAVIDTMGHDVTITQAAQRVDATTGGLTKRGAGSLTFSAPADYIGPTVVEQGSLHLANGATTTGITLAPGTALSLRGGTPDALMLTTASFGPGTRLDLDLGDTLALPAGATFSDLTLGIFPASGTMLPDDTYPVFSFTGTAPSINGLKLAPECFGDATFVINNANSTIDLVVARSANAVAWDNAGHGNWSVGGNWTPFAPAISGAKVLFGDALTSDATVSVDGAVSVASLLFDHTCAYTLAGSTITLANSADDAVIRVFRGAHTLASPLTLMGPTVASVVPGTALRVTDQITSGGNGALTVEGGGAFLLDGTNNTPTAIRDGATVAIPSVASLNGALTLDGGALDVAQGGTYAPIVTLDAGGGSISAGAGQTLTFNSSVTGAGGFAKTGAGTVDVGANAGYTGATVSGGGTLSFATAFPTGPLTLGRGTLAFNGTAANASPVTIASGTNAAVLDVTGMLTLSGPVAVTSGALFKTGPGDVIFDGPHNNAIGLSRFHEMDPGITVGPDGDGPAAGLSALNIANGRVILGADGQTNTIANGIQVGCNTTDALGAETFGELVIAGGYTSVGYYLSVGRNNGNTTTAPDGITSRVRVEGGVLEILDVSVGGVQSPYDGYTGRPVVEIAGGEMRVEREFQISKRAGGVSTLHVADGRLIHLATGQSIRVGQDGGEGILRITGGSAEFVNDVILSFGGAGTTGTLELSGGTLSCKRLYQYNTAGYGRVLFNGGVLKPRNGIDTTITELKIGNGAAVIDTSDAVDIITLSGTLTSAGAADGGLVKTGTGKLAVTGPQDYTGPTVVSNGALRVEGNGSLPAASTLVVLPGAMFEMNTRPPRDVTVGGLVIGSASDPASGNLTLGIETTAPIANDTIIVNGDVTVHKAALTIFVNGSYTENAVPNGSYTLITWTGAGPADASAFRIANALDGKAYTLSVVGKTLRLDVAADVSGTTDAYVWKNTGGGNWTETAKWAKAPGTGAQGIAVRFDDTLAAPAAVAINQNATLGNLFFNGAYAYTLAQSGANALTLDNGGAAAAIQIESGSHTITAPLTLNGETQVKPIASTALTLAGLISGDGALVKQDSGALVIANPANSFTGGVRLISSGTVLTNGASAGTGPITFDASVPLNVGGTGTATAGSVVANVPSSVINVARDSAFASAGLGTGDSFTGTGFVKQGAGEWAFRDTVTVPKDNASIEVREGTLRFADGADYRLGASLRTFLNMTPNFNAERSLVIDEGATLSVPGIHTGYGVNTIRVNGHLDLLGDGSDLMCLRVQNQDAEDNLIVSPTGLFTSESRRFVNIGVRGPAALRVNGGTARLGSLALGFRMGNPDTFGGRWSYAWVSDGGLLDIADNFIWLGDSNAAHRVSRLYVQDGATARLPNTQAFMDNSGWASLVLDGGTFATRGRGLDAPVAGDYLNGLKQLFVNTRGGTVDTEAQSVTFAQPILTDLATNTFAKAGVGTLTLAKPFAWPGLIDVQSGTLNAGLAPSSAGTLPDGLLARYSNEGGIGIDSSGNRRHGTAWGSAIKPTSDPRGGTGLDFPAGSILTVPMDEEMRGMSEYTIAMWVKRTPVTGGGTASTFFTTRSHTDQNVPNQIMLRTYNSKLFFMASSSSGSWPDNHRLSSEATVPANEWFHAACAVTPSGVTLYVNGMPSGVTNQPNMRFTPENRPIGDPGFGIGHPYLRTTPSGEFSGQVDDVQIYNRALTDAEIASIAAVPEPELPALRVASGASFQPQAGASEVRSLEGEGYVSGGLTVRDFISPGDSPDKPAGTSLLAESLTLGDGITYRWDWSPAVSDAIRSSHLAIGGAGTLDLGRAEGQLINGSFRAVLMTYDTIEDAANLANWTVANTGGSGYKTLIYAANGEVVLEYKSTRGTLMILK